MFSIGNEELKNLPRLGKAIICPKCGKAHEIRYGHKIVDGQMIPSKKLAFYRCGKASYLAGIDGVSIIDKPPARRGGEMKPNTIKIMQQLREICKACGHPYACHHAWSNPYPFNYCPGSDCSMDWEKGPGTVFVPSGQYYEPDGEGE